MTPCAGLRDWCSGCADVCLCHAAVLVMMTGLGMLTGSTIAISSGGSCKDNLICSASRVREAAPGQEALSSAVGWWQE